MILTTNILALPLVLLLWAIDVYVFLLSARLVLQHIRAPWTGRANIHLAAFTDPILLPVRRLFARNWPLLRDWVSIAVVLLVLLISRQLLISLLIALSDPVGL
jgi:uncharacterized protein YggT (Ycf19 family)